MLCWDMIIPYRKMIGFSKSKKVPIDNITNKRRQDIKTQNSEAKDPLTGLKAVITLSTNSDLLVDLQFWDLGLKEKN